MLLAKLLSKYLFYFSLLLLAPLLLSAYYQFFSPSHPQPHTFFSFLSTLLISLSISLSLHLFFFLPCI